MPAFVHYICSDPLPRDRNSNKLTKEQRENRREVLEALCRMYSLTLRTRQPCQSAMPKPSSVAQRAQQEPLLLYFFFWGGAVLEEKRIVSLFVMSTSLEKPVVPQQPGATRSLRVFFSFFVLFLFTSESVFQVCVTHRSPLVGF